MLPIPRFACSSVLLVAGILGLPSSARASNPIFGGQMTGAFVVPANASTASGEVQVLIFESNIIVQGSFAGLSAACTTAHVHVGSPTEVGAIAATLTCSAAATGTFTGAIVATPPHIADIRGGRWYVDVHDATFPGGEIRAQARPMPPHVAVLSGAQAVPATASPGTGYVQAVLSTPTTLRLLVSYQDLTDGITGIDWGTGLLGGVDFYPETVAGPNPSSAATLTGITATLTPLDAENFLKGHLYVTIRTLAFPSGAVRGQLKRPDKPFDFDGDTRAEIAVFRPSTGVWYTLNPATGLAGWKAWGAYGDSATSADYDGDGKADLAIWRNGVFWINPSTTGGYLVQPWGTAGIDQPLAPGDFDGDGRADPAVFRRGASSGDPSYYYILQSSNNTPRIFTWGLHGDVDVSADYDGDRRTDPAVYRTSTNTFYILGSTAGMMAWTWGQWATDFLAPGDYDGDGKVDSAVYRYSDFDAGAWYVLKSSTMRLEATLFGSAYDIPVPGDYDGDGRTDKAVVRATASGWTWYVLTSLQQTMRVWSFGLNDDIPIPWTIVR